MFFRAIESQAWIEITVFIDSKKLIKSDWIISDAERDLNFITLVLLDW